MESSSDLVYEGKLIHETTYERRKHKYKEVEISGVKIDFYDHKNKIIHETKKSDKLEEVHEWQLKYYIYIFEKNGISGVTGIIEYPILKQKLEVRLTDLDKIILDSYIKEIEVILNSIKCPSIKKTKICNKCSYYDFCFIGES